MTRSQSDGPELKISPTTSRAEALDALESVLPFDRRDTLAALLTDEDVETRATSPAKAWVNVFRRVILTPLVGDRRPILGMTQSR